MKLVLSFTLTAALMASHGVEAWGNLGHETVGYIAMNFLDPDALREVQLILGPRFNNSLGPAATWADDAIFEQEFAFTIPFHYIAAQDDPLNNNCSVNLTRDCGDAGCSITAVKKYTKQLLHHDQEDQKAQEALLFLTNIIGEIGEPLNNEARGRGGHVNAAICDGNNTNLHEVWDTEMFTKNVNDVFRGNLQTYVSVLVGQIRDGGYESEKDGWVSDINESALSGTDVPLAWAKEANSLDCTVVFNFTSGQNLCEAPYYDTAIPVIERQISKQGYRLAFWLNTLFRVRRQNRA